MTIEAKSRPEQTFFADPAIDRVMGVVMALAGEVWVLRDRVKCLETLLVRGGSLQDGALDAYKPTVEQTKDMAADRDAFVAHLMDNLLGRQAARGPL
jgi:hypothetical protein